MGDPFLNYFRARKAGFGGFHGGQCHAATPHAGTIKGDYSPALCQLFPSDAHSDGPERRGLRRNQVCLRELRQ